MSRNYINNMPPSISFVASANSTVGTGQQAIANRDVPSQRERSTYSLDAHENEITTQTAMLGQTVLGYKLNLIHVPPDIEAFVKATAELEASFRRTDGMAEHIARVIVSEPRRHFYIAAGALRDPIAEWEKQISKQVLASYVDREQRFTPVDRELARQVESMAQLVKLMNDTCWPTMNIRNRPKWSMLDEQARRKALCVYLNAVTIVEHAATVIEPALLVSASRKLAAHLHDAAPPLLPRTSNGEKPESMARFLYRMYPALCRAQRVSALKKMLIGCHSLISIHSTRANEILLRLYGNIMENAFDDVITDQKPFVESSLETLRFISKNGGSPAVRSAADDAYNALSQRLQLHGDIAAVSYMPGENLVDFVRRAIPPVDAPDFSTSIVESTYQQYGSWSIYVRNLVVAQWAQLDGRENEILHNISGLSDSFLEGRLQRNNAPRDVGLSEQLETLTSAMEFVDPATKMDALVLASHCVNALRDGTAPVAAIHIAAAVQRHAERIIQESMNRYDVYEMMVATLALHRVLPSLPSGDRDRTAMRLAAYYSGLMNVLTTEEIFPVIASFSNLVVSVPNSVIRRHEDLFANGLWFLKEASKEFTVPWVRELAKEKAEKIQRRLMAAGIDMDRHYRKSTGMRFALAGEDRVPPDTIPATSHLGARQDLPRVSQKDMQFALMPVESGRLE